LVCPATATSTGMIPGGPPTRRPEVASQPPAASSPTTDLVVASPSSSSGECSRGRFRRVATRAGVLRERVVFVVAAEPDGRLVAPSWRPVEPLVQRIADRLQTEEHWIDSPGGCGCSWRGVLRPFRAHLLLGDRFPGLRLAAASLRPGLSSFALSELSDATPNKCATLRHG